MHRPGHDNDKMVKPEIKKGGEEMGHIIIKKDGLRKLTEDELVFLIDFRRLMDLEKEKSLKFFVCIGDQVPE